MAHTPTISGPNEVQSGVPADFDVLGLQDPAESGEVRLVKTDDGTVVAAHQILLPGDLATVGLEGDATTYFLTVEGISGTLVQADADTFTFTAD